MLPSPLTHALLWLSAASTRHPEAVLSLGTSAVVRDWNPPRYPQVPPRPTQSQQHSGTHSAARSTATLRSQAGRAMGDKGIFLWAGGRGQGTGERPSGRACVGRGMLGLRPCPFGLPPQNAALLGPAFSRCQTLVTACRPVAPIPSGRVWGGRAGSCLLRPCLGRVWNPDVQCSVGGNQPQLKGRLPRTGLGMAQEGGACADCRLLTQGEGRVLCPRVTGTAGHRTSDGQTRQFISHMYSPHTIVHRDTRGQGKQVGLWEAGWVLSRGWGAP